jgi:inorganic triphosphatase YgiF
MAIERELKFRLAPRAARRAVTLLGLGKAERVASLYYDTPDERLRRAHMALRVRRHGARWLQTLKCEVAPGARGEWETPVPGKRLDVARLPRGEIRAASGIDIVALAGRLQPRFETRFSRRTALLQLGDAALEAALDRGKVIAAGRRIAIRELEIELKRGAPRALFRHARSLVEPLALALDFESKAERGYRLAQGAALAPPRKWRRPQFGASTTPGQALASLVGAALVQAAANAHGIVASDDPEYLHQLRVAFRRLRAIVGAFKALEPRAKPLQRRLRRFSPILGTARDWDVFAQSLPPRSALQDAVRKRRAASRRDVRKLVASAAFDDLLLRALQWIDKAPWLPSAEPLVDFAARVLERLHRKALREARRLDWHDPAQRHALRIRVKRLRYACDSFAGCFPAAAVRPYLAAVERLQDDFGALNDRAVARALAAKLGGDARLERALVVRERRLIASLGRDWRAFAARAPFWRAGS